MPCRTRLSVDLERLHMHGHPDCCRSNRTPQRRATGKYVLDAAQRQSDGSRVMIRRELPEDVEAIRAVTAAAFRGVEYSAPPVEPGGEPGEATLVSWLRDDVGWLPELSLVAVEDHA